MVDIFDEVTEELHHDRAVALAKRYGGYLLAACVLVLAGVGAQQVWQSRQAARADQAATQYLALTQTADQQDAGISADQATQTAKALVQFAATAPEGYKVLAKLRAAGLYADSGHGGEAISLWNQVSGDAKADGSLRDLATLLWAEAQAGHAPDDQVLGRIQPLTAQGNAYHALAREVQALVYLHQGKPDLAKALLQQLSTDPSAPDGVRNRAQGLLASLNG
ncbi:tetratricopeptide repeat protein [Acidocella sp.]|uniref:tetratricopeptide repeat protein n=1 Tax=Acidocella sp. TaxID=50710 RepID=UPI00262F1C7C|nr:tetratricopeptide repeat protein [Acidocella sp.]